MTGFRIISVSFGGKSGRSDWIRTSDPYPPRKQTTAKSLIYRAARCGTVLATFASVHLFPYPIRITGGNMIFVLSQRTGGGND